MDDNLFNDNNPETGGEYKAPENDGNTAQEEPAKPEYNVYGSGDYAPQPENEPPQAEYAPQESGSTPPQGEYREPAPGYGPQQGGYYNPQYGYGPQQSGGNNQQYGYNQQPQGGGYYGNQPGYGAPQRPNVPEPPEPGKKKNAGAKVFIAIIVVILVFAGIIVAYLFRSGGGKPSIPEEKTTASQSEDKTGRGKIDTSGAGALDVVESADPAADMNEIYEVASKFNVGILVYVKDQLYTEGSGIIAEQDESGEYTYILTCAHVIDYNGAEFTVLTKDGTKYKAEVVGKDKRTDVGVLRIEASGLSTAEFADSSALVVGQQVFAIGNPGGSEFFGSFTNGIISAIDRPISAQSGYENDCIQHSAAINPGNSGGALVNSAGQVIGINSSKIADTDYEGMGFAVPSNVVMKIYKELVSKGYISRAKLGIRYTTPANYSQQYSMYVQIQKLPAGSIVIAEIDPDSNLAEAGVQKGDLIIGMNGKKLESTDTLAKAIENMEIGDEIELEIVRIDSRTWTHDTMTVKVKLVEDTGTTAEESTTQGYSQDDLEEYFRQFFGGSGFGGFSGGNGY